MALQFLTGMMTGFPTYSRANLTFERFSIATITSRYATQVQIAEFPTPAGRRHNLGEFGGML